MVEMTKSFFALFFHLFYVGNGNHIDLSSSPYAEDDVEFNSVRIEEQEIDFISLLRIYQQYDKEQRKENYWKLNQSLIDLNYSYTAIKKKKLVFVQNHIFLNFYSNKIWELHSFCNLKSGLTNIPTGNAIHRITTILPNKKNVWRTHLDFCVLSPSSFLYSAPMCILSRRYYKLKITSKTVNKPFKKTEKLAHSQKNAENQDKWILFWDKWHIGWKKKTLYKYTRNIDE